MEIVKINIFFLGALQLRLCIEVLFFLNINIIYSVVTADIIRYELAIYKAMFVCNTSY